MNFFSKLVIAVLIILSIIFIKDKFLGNYISHNDVIQNQTEQEQLPAETKSEKPPTPKVEKQLKIYFAKESGEATLLKPVNRESTDSEHKLELAITELLKGPSPKERQGGVFSEIPKGTRILAIKKDKKSIIIDLSEDFQYGGGTQSQYVRVKQLIKTVLGTNPDKPVYLYLNGQKAEVIGGEGIILNQPLSENSLND